MSSDLERSIAALFGAGISVAVTDSAAAHPLLLPTEAVAMRRAVPRRLAEFTAGRAAARIAMQRLGLPPQAVPAAPDRSPVWPAGLNGSISHANGICAAVLTRDTALRLGLDLEDPAPLDPDLWPLVLTLTELSALEEVPIDERGVIAKRVFCIKEAAYKAQFPLTGAVIGFQALEVIALPFPDSLVQFDSTSVRATVVGTMVPKLAKLFPNEGSIIQTAGPRRETCNLLVAALTLPC